MGLTIRREQHGRNQRRNRRRSLGLLTTVAVFVAASCTGDDAATTPDRPPIESTQLDTGTATAEGGSLTGGDVTVEIAFAGGGVAGDVSMAGDHRGSFAADEAIDDAGLYRASATIDGDEVTGAWIVLDDGSQRGRFWWSEEEEEELQM